MTKQTMARVLVCLAGLAVATPALSSPEVTRLTPPSRLFSTGSLAGPQTSRFLPGQRFDLQATVAPDAGQTITSMEFLVDGVLVAGPVTLTAATVTTVPPGSMIGTLRAYSNMTPGVHTLTVVATQSDTQQVMATGSFEVVTIQQAGFQARNVIIFIGDGLGIAHRTAARLMKHGATQGKSDGLLAMDQLPETAIVTTHSLNSIVTDSSPGAACYSTGNKSNNNQHGVFPDDTTNLWDNPRMENIGEYLSRTRGMSLGIVTTSDVFDATPASFATHTQSRAAGTGICDMYLDESANTGLRVLLGGGRKWFLPASTSGSARVSTNDAVVPQDLADAWGVPVGQLDPERNLIQDFVDAGWSYLPDKTSLEAVSQSSDRLVGLFALSNMNVALDKVNGRRGASTVVDDYGFPRQPMLDEMTRAAIRVLQKNNNGFVLMVEAASIDKQAHNMDTERWILDTIEFDEAVSVGRGFADRNGETLVIVTSDHECAGINIIGGSRVTDADLAARAVSGGGSGQLRANVVGTYESAGFPRYTLSADGFPVTTDIDFRMLIGYAANGDRYEDWRTNPQPLRDSQQPFNNVPPLSLYPGGPLERDVAGQYLVTGQIADVVAAHTASDVPLSAGGRGSGLFRGVMDNTDVFFKTMQAVIGGWF